MNDKNIIYSVMEGGYINCHTNGTIYKNYDEFKKEMLCYYGKEELINKINNLQFKIDKANELLEEILVVSDWEHKGRFRPVKGTTAQDVYKTIVKLNELLETPRKINYELLKEDK